MGNMLRYSKYAGISFTPLEVIFLALADKYLKVF
jgi:hypothetical protein